MRKLREMSPRDWATNSMWSGAALAKLVAVLALWLVGCHSPASRPSPDAAPSGSRRPESTAWSEPRRDAERRELPATPPTPEACTLACDRLAALSTDRPSRPALATCQERCLEHSTSAHVACVLEAASAADALACLP